MNSVLVGLFDSEADALAARGKLTAAGFSAAALQMTGGATSAAVPGASTTSTATSTAPHAEGAIARFFENLFGSDESDDERDLDHRSTYTEAFKRGSYGLTVHAASEAEMEKAEQILNASGAIDIDARSEQWRKDGWTGSGAAGTVAPGATQKLQEVQEALTVDKRAVDRGGVRVFTRVTETPVEKSVSLREERATIKRTVVDRVASAADLAAFKEGSVEVRATGEEAIVHKTSRVVGEVEVGRTATEREETIRDTVRQSKVEVEEIAADRSGGVKR